MADRQQSDKSIFLEAIEQTSAPQRAGYLDQACAENPQLRADVEALLQAHEKPQGLLDAPEAAVPTVAQPPILEGPGTLIGPYKLMEQIGEGGMGLVFVAEQQQPVRRKVALKVIKPGMDTRQVIGRFEAERQALALMDHPNIAKVLDAGTTGSSEPRTSVSGPLQPLTDVRGSERPYFVMELVKGVPITQFCDDNRLTPRERLELFVHVCQAVQHAHQKGIIHRDIKPSNVLVSSHDGTPVVKVIDFGVAKAIGQQLTDKSVYTQLAQLIGTPLYMSPEQAGQSSLDVDTRSDIYSLGVLLYELLTGTTPFDKDRFKEVDYDELRRIIREEEPPKPSTRVSTLGQAATTFATQRKSDPKRLSQLIRGELDWIVMKALEKDRNRRYETASAFAADVRRYLHDEPVLACPPSAAYRLRKFVRRNKAALAVTGLILFFLVLLGGGVGWIANDRTARYRELTKEVEGAMSQAADFQKAGNWPEGRAALQRAQSLLATVVDDARLRQRADDLLAELNMAARLEEIKLEREAVKNEEFDFPGADASYAQTFQDYGLDVEALSEEEAAARIRQKPICAELTAALDDWALTRQVLANPSWTKILALARAVDPNDDDGKRSLLRQALERGEAKTLRQMAADAGRDALSPSTALFLAAAFPYSDRTQADLALAVALLRKTQQQHPDDFWINHQLAWRLQTMQPPLLDEAIGFYRAALALRSRSPGVHNNLGVALQNKGDLPGAIAACEKAIALKPDCAPAHTNLGNAFSAMGRLDEAIAQHREAIRLKNDYALAHNNLGNALKAKGKPDEAIAEFREAIRLKKDFANAHGNLGAALCDKGRLDEAIAECQEAIRLKKDFAEAHTNLGNALREKGRLDEAIAQQREAIRLKKDYAEAHNGLGATLCDKGRLDEAIAESQEAIRLKKDYAEAHCNLGAALKAKGKLDEAIPEFREAIRLKKDFANAHSNLGNALREKGRLDEAIAEIHEAIRLKKDYAEAHYNLGIALRAKGKLDEAIAEYHEAVRLKKDYAEAHCNLGYALVSTGQFAQALAFLRRGHELGSRDPRWRYPSAQWVRNCERLVALDDKLPDVLSGKEQPADTAERLALGQFCQEHKKCYATAARFYAEGFAAEPKLIGDPPSGLRYNAACAAALAGCGQGEDAKSLDDKERTRLRCQALDWLRADLTAWRRLLEKEPAKARAAVVQQMQHWQKDPDFAQVRGSDALAKLPEAERPAWRQLWADVEETLITVNPKDPTRTKNKD